MNRHYIKSIPELLKSEAFSREEKIDILKERAKKKLLGSKDKTGILINLVKYVLLISIGFVYLYPLLYMFITSFMSLDDLLDTSVKWIPSKMYLKNFKDALMVMDFKTNIWKSLYIPIVPTLIQVAVCAVVGYGFARYRFFGKNIFMALMLFTFILPPQVTMMPTYVLYTDLKFLGSMKAFVIPALLGQGFKSAIFILIYYQFFKQIPKSLLEAAQIDGAGHWKSFFRIALPSAVPAIIVVFLFSFIWYYNETYLVALYLNNSGLKGGSKLTTLLIELQNFEQSYSTIYPATENTVNRLNEAIRMAGTMVSIAPLLAIYALLQKHFVESVDRTGITGE
ncbi:MAG: carbohydrate ABC transporter permease [Vallitaleaceae bacterium]|nr:carbohydrate ABC transporter permease [Vallitaleaceae bacterium]